MDRQIAIETLEGYRDTIFEDSLDAGADALRKLDAIEKLINQPLVKARGAVGTEKIREILEAR